MPLRQRGACAERRGLLALLQAELLRGCPKLHGISLENNNFTEEGLLTIAEARTRALPPSRPLLCVDQPVNHWAAAAWRQAAEAHPGLSELSVAFQRAIISTAAQNRLIAAMDTSKFQLEAFAAGIDQCLCETKSEFANRVRNPLADVG